MRKFKKISIFTNDEDAVNKIKVEEYQIAVGLNAYEENKAVRQETLDEINNVKRISASDSLQGTRLTKKYKIDFRNWILM